MRFGRFEGVALEEDAEAAAEVPRHATPRHATPRHATPRHARTPHTASCTSHHTPHDATPRHRLLRQFRAIKRSWFEQGRVDLEWPCSKHGEVGESPQACADRGRRGVESLLRMAEDDEELDKELPVALVAHGSFNKVHAG